MPVGVEFSAPFDTGLIGPEFTAPFDMGGIGGTLSAPFLMEGVPIGREMSVPFELSGGLGATFSAPFDMSGPIGATFIAPFEMVSDVIIPDWGVWTPTGFYPSIFVFNKAGAPLGSISTFSVTDPPTQSIMTSRTTSAAQGRMSFILPKTLDDGQTDNPDTDLVQGDRLVALGVEVGGPLWAGAMAPQEYSKGVLSVECPDLYEQLVNTPDIDMDVDVADGTPAWAVMKMVLNKMNSIKAADHELLWSFEHSGTKRYRGGRFTYTGDGIGAVEDIVSNAGVEVMWRADIVNNNLKATLIQSDRFETVSAHALFDGPGGNIMANPRIIRDPTRVVSEIKVIGEATNLEDCLPDYAKWAIANSTPSVTVSVPPGDRRRRARLDVTVPWGYSKSTIDHLCRATLEEVWDLFYSFLRAVHDIEGRPFHEGYTYDGPTAYFDSKESGSHVLSRYSFRTRLQLVETFRNVPASAVMISDSAVLHNMHTWLIVDYNRKTGEKKVQFWPFPSVAGASISRYGIGDGRVYTRYTVSGRRIISRATVTVAPGETAGTSGWCESYNTRIYDPTYRRYRFLRRIIAGNNYGKYFDPSDPDIHITDMGPGAGIDFGTLSQLIGKVYDFEFFNIDKWDPFRDGVGEQMSKPSVFNGAYTTRERWHIVPYSSGSNAATNIVTGLGTSDVNVLVASLAGWPTPESPDFPFKASIDEGPDREVVLVRTMNGLNWVIRRGQDGTTPVIHEPGAPVHRVGGEVPNGLTPLNPPWPEGKAYADELLALMSQDITTLEFDIANLDDDWRAADFGAVMPVTLTTEGPFTGTVRVLGRSPDVFGAHGQPGSMRVVAEVVTGG